MVETIDRIETTPQPSQPEMTQVQYTVEEVKNGIRRIFADFYKANDDCSGMARMRDLQPFAAALRDVAQKLQFKINSDSYEEHSGNGHSNLK